MKHPQATTIMVLGIVSVVLLLMCGLLTLFLSIPAWVMGHKARREMQERPGLYSGDGEITAGWVMGMVSTILACIGVVVIAIFVIAAAAS